MGGTQVDQRSESLLIPIYGVMVPFHILMVKSATFNQGDGDHAYIRINFNFGPSFEPCTRNPTSIFLKELSLRTSDPRHAAKVASRLFPLHWPRFPVVQCGSPSCAGFFLHTALLRRNRAFWV